jgi:hypothetical protein
MKSNRWWIRGCSLRVLKRYLPKGKFKLSFADLNTSSLVHWDGCAIRISDWEDMLEEVRALKPGDKIFNPYAKTWQKITEIEFVWDTGYRRPSHRKIADNLNTIERRYGVGKFVIYDLIMIERYQYIGGFIIYDDIGNSIYHTPSDMAHRYPEYHQPIDGKKHKLNPV